MGVDGEIVCGEEEVREVWKNVTVFEECRVGNFYKTIYVVREKFHVVCC